MIALLLAISFIGECHGSTSCTPPTHAVGDLFIAYTYRSATTAPSLPSGWTSVLTASASASSTRVGCKVATTTSETSGTWTNATNLEIVIYRGVAAGTTANCNTNVVGGSANTTGASTTLTYSAITMGVADGTSWAIGCVGQTSGTTLDTNGVPTGMTIRSNNSGASICSDTNGGISSWSSTNATISSANRWRSAVLEIKAACTGVCPVNTVCRAACPTGTSCPVTVTTTAGDDVVVCTSMTATITVVSIADGGSTYVQRAIKTGALQSVELWSARSVVGGSTVTLTLNVGVYDGLYATVCVTDYSGVQALGNTATVGPTTSAAPSGAVTTQDANNVAVLCGGTAAGNTWTSTAGIIEGQAINGPVGSSAAVMDLRSASATSVTLSASIDSSIEWDLALLELRSTTGGGGGDGGTPTPSSSHRTLRGAGTMRLPVDIDDRRLRMRSLFADRAAAAG